MGNHCRAVVDPREGQSIGQPIWGAAMKAYLVTTATLFGLIAVLHGWRVFEERSSLARDPWFLIITVIAAVLAGWGISLLRRGSSQA